MFYRYLKQFVAALFLFSHSIMAFSQFAASGPTKTVDIKSLPRLDVPISASNSVLVNLGGNASLRIPKTLVPATMIPKDPRLPIQADQLSMIFLYPDMLQLPDYQGSWGEIVTKASGRWEWSLPIPDHFPVLVRRLFYSTEDMTSIDTINATRGPDWRPLDRLHFIENSVRNDGRLHDYRGLTDAKITLFDSKYEGLRGIQVPITDRKSFEASERIHETWKKDGWDGDKGAQYVERIGSPYELYMICQSPSSTKCEADVYIRSNHFQYKVVFPPGEVAHTDKLIRTINKMIDGWSHL